MQTPRGTCMGACDTCRPQAPGPKPLPQVTGRSQRSGWQGSAGVHVMGAVCGQLLSHLPLRGPKQRAPATCTSLYLGAWETDLGLPPRQNPMAASPELRGTGVMLCFCKALLPEQSPAPASRPSGGPSLLCRGQEEGAGDGDARSPLQSGANGHPSFQPHLCFLRC